MFGVCLEQNVHIVNSLTQKYVFIMVRCIFFHFFFFLFAPKFELRKEETKWFTTFCNTDLLCWYNLISVLVLCMKVHGHEGGGVLFVIRGLTYHNTVWMDILRDF